MRKRHRFQFRDWGSRSILIWTESMLNVGAFEMVDEIWGPWGIGKEQGISISLPSSEDLRRDNDGNGMASYETAIKIIFPKRIENIPRIEKDC